MLFAQVTDIHIGFDPEDPEEMNTRRFLAVLERLIALDPQPAFLLCTGDLTETGQGRHYARLREMLDRLPFPYHVIPGNHDKRPALLEVFPETPSPSGFVQYAFDAGPLRIVMLDTSDEKRHGGVFCETRAAWLEAELASHDRPTVIAMHHPPAPSAVPWITAHEYEPWVQRLRTAIGRHAEQVVGIIAGHYHRPMTAMWAKAGVFVCPSSAPRVGLDMRPFDLEHPADMRPLVVEEPASFGLHYWSGESLVSHSVIVGDYAVLARVNEPVGQMVKRLIAERSPEAAAAERAATERASAA